MIRRFAAAALLMLASQLLFVVEARAQSVELTGDLCGTGFVGRGTEITLHGVARGLEQMPIVGATTLLALDGAEWIEPLGQAGEASRNFSYAFGGNLQGVSAEYEGAYYASYAGALAGDPYMEFSEFPLFTFTARVAEDAAEGTHTLALSNALGAGNTVYLDGGAEIPLAVGSACEITVTRCQSDGDGDGFGAADDPTCVDPRPDCDDSNAAVHPGAREIIGNDVDDDCSALTPDVVETGDEATVVLEDVLFEDEGGAADQDCGYIVRLLLDLIGGFAL